MYRKLLAILMVIGVAALASGCVGREIVLNPTGDMAPDISIKDNVEIDWNQVVDDTTAILNNDEYPKGRQITFSTHDEDMNQPIELIWVVGGSCPPEDAALYAEAYVKAFNDAVATQDFKYAFSSGDSYGGFWDEHDCNIMVYYDGDDLKPDQYIVSQTIKAGSNAPIELQDAWK